MLTTVRAASSLNTEFSILTPDIYIIQIQGDGWYAEGEIKVEYVIELILYGVKKRKHSKMNFVLCESFGANVHESASKQASRILMQIIPNPSCKTFFLSDKQKNQG